MPEKPTRHLDDAASAEALAARWSFPDNEIAVDLELDAMHAFRSRLCLVQLADDQQIALLDPLRPGVTLAPLAPLLSDERITKFFHAAGGDLQYLSLEGVRVAGLFDTHRAVTLLGWPKVGLADLVREIVGVELSKEHQQSDFGQRPLPQELEAYAADDVRYLVEVGRKVRLACKEADILEEVELDCARACAEAAAPPDLEGLAPKLSVGTLPEPERRLARYLAQRLHALRLEWAEAEDVPYGRVLSNAAIKALAVRPSSDLKTLARTQGVRGRFVREHGDTLLELFASARRALDEGTLTLPERLVEAPDPLRRKRADALRAFRVAAASKRKVTPSVVLPNPLIEALSKAPPADLEALAAVPYFGEKRARLHGKGILKALDV